MVVIILLDLYPSTSTIRSKSDLTAAPTGMYSYENTFVNENGVWKIKLLQVGGVPRKEIVEYTLKEELATHERYSAYPFTESWPRTTSTEYGPYIRPFSFKHPVTGKDVNKEIEEWNKAHPVPIPAGGENWTK